MEDANDAQASGLHGPVRALTLAVAEMYVQGVSTRRATKIVQHLCGLEVTSTQVISGSGRTG